MPPPRTLQIDNVDRLPPHGAPDTPPWSHPMPARSYDWASILALGGVAALLLLIGYWLFAGDVRRWLAYGDGYWISVWLPRLALLAAVAFLAKRWWLIRQPGGFEVPWVALSGPETVRGILSVHQAHASTAFKQVAAYTLTEAAQGPQISTTIEPQMIDAEVVPSGPKMLPSAEWLDWFDARPHGLLAAETGGGKSTLFKVIAKSRIERGELLFLLDPHSSDWFGLPAIGGGEDWSAIWNGMQVVIAEYKARLAERDAYLQQFKEEKPVDDFQRITVLLDEANTACQKLSHGTRRGEESRWDQFAQALGSGARKVGISIQLLAQSPNVEDLNLSGPMLNNFTRICLDARTIQMLVNQGGGTTDAKRELTQTIEGQEYPAATTIKGKVVLLDRAGLDRISAPRNPQDALWTDGYDRTHALISGQQQPAQRVVSASSVPSATVRASVPVVPPVSLTQPIEQIAWYAANTDLSTRAIRDQLRCDYSRVVDVCGKVRGPRGARLRAHYQRII